MSSYISKSVRNGQYIEIIKIYFSNARYNITKKKYLPTKDKPMICVIDLSCKYVSKMATGPSCCSKFQDYSFPPSVERESYTEIPLAAVQGFTISIIYAILG